MTTKRRPVVYADNFSLGHEQVKNKFIKRIFPECRKRVRMLGSSCMNMHMHYIAEEQQMLQILHTIYTLLEPCAAVTTESRE